MSSTPESIRIGAYRRAKIVAVATKIELTYPETIRQAIDYGLPIVKKKFAKKK
jgi:hypothetical protein